MHGKKPLGNRWKPLDDVGFLQGFLQRRSQRIPASHARAVPSKVENSVVEQQDLVFVA